MSDGILVHYNIDIHNIQQCPLDGTTVFVQWNRGKRLKGETKQAALENRSAKWEESFSFCSTLFPEHGRGVHKPKLMKFEIIYNTFEKGKNIPKRAGHFSIDLAKFINNSSTNSSTRLFDVSGRTGNRIGILKLTISSRPPEAWEKKHSVTSEMIDISNPLSLAYTDIAETSQTAALDGRTELSDNIEHEPSDVPGSGPRIFDQDLFQTTSMNRFDELRPLHQHSHQKSELSQIVMESFSPSADEKSPVLEEKASSPAPEETLINELKSQINALNNQLAQAKEDLKKSTESQQLHEPVIYSSTFPIILNTLVLDPISDYTHEYPVAPLLFHHLLAVNSAIEANHFEVLSDDYLHIEPSMVADVIDRYLILNFLLIQQNSKNLPALLQRLSHLLTAEIIYRNDLDISYGTNSKGCSSWAFVNPLKLTELFEVQLRNPKSTYEVIYEPITKGSEVSSQDLLIYLTENISCLITHTYQYLIKLLQDEMAMLLSPSLFLDEFLDSNDEMPKNNGAVDFMFQALDSLYHAAVIENKLPPVISSLIFSVLIRSIAVNVFNIFMNPDTRLISPLYSLRLEKLCETFHLWLDNHSYGHMKDIFTECMDLVTFIKIPKQDFLIPGKREKLTPSLNARQIALLMMIYRPDTVLPMDIPMEIKLSFENIAMKASEETNPVTLATDQSPFTVNVTSVIESSIDLPKSLTSYTELMKSLGLTK